MSYNDWVFTHPNIKSANLEDVIGEQAVYFEEITTICNRKYVNRMNNPLSISTVSFFSVTGINMSCKSFLEHLQSLSLKDAFDLNHIFYAMKKGILLVDKGYNNRKSEYLSFSILVQSQPTYNYQIAADKNGKLLRFIRRYQLSHIKLDTDLLSVYRYAKEIVKSHEAGE